MSDDDDDYVSDVSDEPEYKYYDLEFKYETIRRLESYRKPSAEFWSHIPVNAGRGGRGRRKHLEDELIEYKMLPSLYIANPWCDECGRSSDRVELVRLQGFYRGTNIPVSRLFRTDLQTALWSEPYCLGCSMDWTRRFRAYLDSTIINATIVLQRWFRVFLYAPPSTRQPRGGLYYRQAKEHFEEQNENEIF